MAVALPRAMHLKRVRRSPRTFASVSATIAVLPVTIGILWACGWYAAGPPPLTEWPSAGVTRGRVWKTDFESRTVRVGGGLFGRDAVPFTVSSQTRVVVGEKEGAFGDLHEGVSVRIQYVRHDDDLVAVCVESLRLDEGGAGGGCDVSPAGVVSLDR